MRRSRSFDLLPFDPQIEHTCKRLNSERREALHEQQLIMVDEALHANEDERPLRDYVVPFHPQIEHTCRRLNNERREALQKQQLIMADEALHANEDERPLKDYVVPIVNSARPSIARHAV